MLYCGVLLFFRIILLYTLRKFVVREHKVEDLPHTVFQYTGLKHCCAYHDIAIVITQNPYPFINM